MTTVLNTDVTHFLEMDATKAMKDALKKFFSNLYLIYFDAVFMLLGPIHVGLLHSSGE